MEQVIDPEIKIIDIEIEFEEEKEESEYQVPLSSENREDSAPKRTNLYGRIVGGLSAILFLLIVPFLTFPGMILLVLVAEIYLIDWTYSKVSLLRAASSSQSMKDDSIQESSGIIDQKNPRSNPKDQFVK